MRLQILGYRGNPFGEVGRARPRRAVRRWCCATGACAQASGEFTREPLDIGGTHREPVVGFRSGERGRAFDHVKTIHVLYVVGHAPRASEVLLVTHRAWTAEEVGVERDDDRGLVEVVDRLGGLLPAVGRGRPRRDRTGAI